MFKIILLVSFFSLSTIAKDAAKCANEEGYINSGWKIHSASKFSSLYNSLKKKLDKGISQGDFILDMSGPIMNRNTTDHSPRLLRATSWDDLRTNQMEMFGDVAIYTDIFNENIIAEIRWYDGKNRNLVLNPKFLNCMTDSAPYADNSIL